MTTVTWGANTTHTYGGGDAPSTAAATGAAASGAAPAPAAGFAFGAPAAAGGGLGGFGSAGGATATGTGAAPAPFSFGSPAPASSFSFGATPAAGTSTAAGGLFGGGGAFGTPAPAPAAGGLFGGSSPATPAPSTGFGLFGTSASAGSSSSFGGGGFGTGATTGGGLFGSSAAQQPSAFGGGLFGSPQPQQQPPQPAANLMPAQAALQAHLQAQARQEEARVTNALADLHQAYSGTAAAPDPVQSAPFAAVLYTDLTPELRQQQWLQGLVARPTGSDSGIALAPRPVVPPRPAQISENDWNAAVARNPDFASCMPTAVVGALALQARLSYQQQAADQLSQHYRALQDTLKACDPSRLSQHLAAAADRHAQQKHRLLRLVRQVELLRCANLPLQKDEADAVRRLRELHAHLEQRLRPMVGALQDRARAQGDRPLSAPRPPRRQPPSDVAVPADPLLERAVRDQRDALERLQSNLRKQVRDVQLLRERLAADAAVVPVAPFAAVATPWRHGAA